MREKLDNNYIISFNNIIDIIEKYPKWKIDNAEFAKGYNKTVSKQILVQENKQIKEDI